jgi:uncharacterized protein DUF3987
VPRIRTPDRHNLRERDRLGPTVDVDAHDAAVVLLTVDLVIPVAPTALENDPGAGAPVPKDQLVRASLGRVGQLAPIADWASKLAGHVVRIAALLHLTHTFTTGYGGPVTDDTTRDAERVGRYYLDHALAVYDLMG